MTDPAPAPAQPTALSDPDNVGWVEIVPGKLSEEDAYWIMRGMIPPAHIQLEE